VNCTASVIDIDAGQVTATIAWPGRPRWAACDPASGQGLRLHPPARPSSRSTPATPASPRAIDVPADGPHGLQIDGQRLYCAADGGSLIVIDRDSGTVQAAVPLPGIPDVVMHDPALQPPAALRLHGAPRAR
jgi:hypothetical protein